MTCTCVAAGLRNLQHLSFGWCRSLGAVACDPSNNIQALASLTALTYLNLGGTQVCDAQLRLVLPHLTVLEVREQDVGVLRVLGGGGAHVFWGFAAILALQKVIQLASFRCLAIL